LGWVFDGKEWEGGKDAILIPGRREEVVMYDSRVCCNLTGKSSGTSAANKLDLVEV
jgi:hypothetical protein